MRSRSVPAVPARRERSPIVGAPMISSFSFVMRRSAVRSRRLGFPRRSPARVHGGGSSMRRLKAARRRERSWTRKASRDTPMPWDCLTAPRPCWSAKRSLRCRGRCCERSCRCSERCFAASLWQLAQPSKRRWPATPPRKPTRWPRNSTPRAPNCSARSASPKPRRARVTSSSPPCHTSCERR